MGLGFETWKELVMVIATFTQHLQVRVCLARAPSQGRLYTFGRHSDLPGWGLFIPI